MTDTIYLGGNIPGLQLSHQGKVRDIFALRKGLLLVTTDRISAFDVVLPDGIPNKGKVLTGISSFWFEKTKQIFPNHLITDRVEDLDEVPRSHWDALRGRILLGKPSDVIPFEFIVRGYLSGSGYSDYKKTGSICGIKLPSGLQESDKLPRPILTPTTKAKTGHDLPVEFSQVVQQIGKDVAEKVRDAALKLYQFASDFAASKGVLIADTKFEFGICQGQILVIDEILTPDSSRFWPAEHYQPGKSQPSYDKQIVRDHLVSTGWSKTPPGPRLPQEIIDKASRRYQGLYERLTGKKVN